MIGPLRLEELQEQRQQEMAAGLSGGKNLHNFKENQTSAKPEPSLVSFQAHFRLFQSFWTMAILL